MTGTLVVKLLRDVRLALLMVGLLLAAYECLWAKIVERISGELLPLLLTVVRVGVTPRDIEEAIFGGPGKILQSMIGGENISMFRVRDALTIGYVHPVIQAILCIWAVGRSAGAIAGEIDRGTMELLLAQPVPRSRLVLAHFCVDCITIPILCSSLWAGNWLGRWLVGVQDDGPLPGLPGPIISPMIFLPSLANVAALVFALSGFTMWLSARGRFRGRVLGLAVFLVLLQFLINVIGQLLDQVAWMRPFTVFYYYQPQQIILNAKWNVSLGTGWSGKLSQPLFSVNVIVVLVAVGIVGYMLALRRFCTRDLPAPL
jgi:ABC-2 type transport system permease protein